MSNRWGIAKFILKRLAFGVFTLFVISVLVFAATQLLPSNAAARQLGRDATAERVAALKKELGLDKPKFEQYTSWLGNLLQGDAGRSLLGSRSKVTTMLGDSMRNSLVLTVLASVVSIPISLWLGSYMARRSAPVTNNIMLALASVPEFVIGIVLGMLFTGASAGIADLLPGTSTLDAGQPPWDDWQKLVLPTVVLAAGAIPYISRTARASLVEVMQSDYVEMARLKGLSERTVMRRHAFPNALGPVFQVIALNVAYFAAGIIVVEYIFNYPGLGGSLLEAVKNRDLPVVQFCTMLLAGVYVVTNIAADLATVLVTPRLRTKLQ